MKGILFLNEDAGRGGNAGFVHTFRKWCTWTQSGLKHVSEEVTETKVEITVIDCDTSCYREEVEIPLHVVEKVKEIMSTPAQPQKSDISHPCGGGGDGY